MLYLTWILAPLLLAVLLAGSVRRIPEGQVYSVHRLGRPARMLHAGVHVMWPLLERVGHKISLTGRVLDLTPSDDGALQGTVYWQVLEPQRADGVISEAEKLLRQTLGNAATSQPIAADTKARAEQLKNRVNEQLHSRGLLVTRIDLA